MKPMRKQIEDSVIHGCRAAVRAGDVGEDDVATHVIVRLADERDELLALLRDDGMGDERAWLVRKWDILAKHALAKYPVAL
jgi:hypothetical protein